MGGSNSAEQARNQHILQTILDPQHEEDLKKLFDELDTDKSGALEEAEWRQFASLLFSVDFDTATQKVKQEVKTNYQLNTSNLPFFVSWVGKFAAPMAASATEMLEHKIRPTDIQEWVCLNIFTKLS